MTSTITYAESIYRKPEGCLTSMAARLANGWQVSDVHREGRTFVVVYSQERAEDPDASIPAMPAP